MINRRTLNLFDCKMFLRKLLQLKGIQEYSPTVWELIMCKNKKKTLNWTYFKRPIRKPCAHWVQNVLGLIYEYHVTSKIKPPVKDPESVRKPLLLIELGHRLFFYKINLIFTIRPFFVPLSTHLYKFRKNAQIWHLRNFNIQNGQNLVPFVSLIFKVRDRKLFRNIFRFQVFITLMTESAKNFSLKLY